MKEQINVSVIIPVYNVEKYLEECLNSIIGQSLTQIEIICVNDGSTDRSGDILRRYQKKDTRISVYEKMNGGQSSARNLGLRKATGKYLYFMDSDDYLEPGALETLYDESERLNLDVLYFSGRTFWENDKLKETHAGFKDSYNRGNYDKGVLTGIEMLGDMCDEGRYIVSPCLQFINRQYFSNQSISFYEGIIHEDNLFTFLIIVGARRTACINDILFNRRIRMDSTMTKKAGAENARGTYVCLKEIYQYIKNHTFTSKQEKTLVNVLDELVTLFIDRYNNTPEVDRRKIIDSESPVELWLFNSFMRPRIEQEGLKINYDLMINSKSYKVGRMVTCVPRKIRGLFFRDSNSAD
ncbi:glycosyltransferase [bacterium C-53]|nr:glycosyltransferase [Lachnospiraceae bacterium]NBI02635.1 glycosyltransferase [Lachnospiraceae bacterium]RKJ11274.1 glycosyltransferase [bacterium C-53]